MKKLFIFVFSMFLSVSSAFAVDIPSVMKQTMAHETAGMPSLLNLIVSMIVVIALIYVTGWIYAKLNIVNRNKLNKLASQNDDKFHFNVVQTMPLGQQRHLYTVEINGKILLIGATASHINVLKEFDKTSCEVSFTQDTAIEDDKQINDKNIIKSSVDIDELYEKYKS